MLSDFRGDDSCTTLTTFQAYRLEANLINLSFKTLASLVILSRKTRVICLLTIIYIAFKASLYSFTYKFII